MNKSLQYKKEEHVELENSGKDHVTLDARYGVEDRTQ
jgi:hypothetical protein